MNCLVTIPLQEDSLTPLTRNTLALRDSISECLEKSGFEIFSCSVGFGNIQFEIVAKGFINADKKIKNIIKSFGFSDFKIKLG